MIPQLNTEHSIALHNDDHKPMPIVDPTTNHAYFVFVVDQATHERSMYALAGEWMSTI